MFSFSFFLFRVCLRVYPIIMSCVCMRRLWLLFMLCVCFEVQYSEIREGTFMFMLGRILLTDIAPSKRVCAYRTRMFT